MHPCTADQAHGIVAQPLPLLELAASPYIGNGASPLSDGRSPLIWGGRPRRSKGADSSKTNEKITELLWSIQNAI
jgi:hypothetical protein